MFFFVSFLLEIKEINIYDNYILVTYDIRNFFLYFILELMTLGMFFFIFHP